MEPPGGSLSYQEQLFSRDMRGLNRSAILAWRERFRRIAERYPPRVDLDLRDLADMASALVDGGITLSKTPRDPALMPKQVMPRRASGRAIFALD